MRTVSLSEITFSLESGSRPKAGVTHLPEVPSLGGEHISEDGSIRKDKLRFITHSTFQNLRSGRVEIGDILIVKDGATTGKTAFFNGIEGFNEVALNEHVFRLQLNADHADSRFVYWFLRSERGQAEIAKDFRGATVGGISRDFISKVQVPLPLLSEQKRFALILDTTDTLRAKRREALAQLDTLFQSTFLDMFGDPVTNPKGWEVMAFGEVGKVITGNTPPRSHLEYYGDDIEWIKSDNINNPSYFLTKAEENLSASGKKVARIAPKGSILVTCIAGSPSSIGNAAIADREVAFNQQINAFVPGNLINVWFAFGLFRFGKRLVQRASTNSMKGMVSKSAFRAIQAPVAPRLLQSRFAEVAESIQRQIARQHAHLAELDLLFASLQSRAFRGEL
jgi:type I restriction enzyme S subunit